MPVINVGNRGHPIYLPPEVCTVVEGQFWRSKLNTLQSRQMIKVAVRKPWENAFSIVKDGKTAVGLSRQVNTKLVRCTLIVDC